jgi:hypothetical protein
MQAGVDPLYRRGVGAFNRGAYFDAHDLWEECWIAEGRPTEGFFKGLVQAAVAMYHLTHGNCRGARKLIESSRRYLEPSDEEHHGLDTLDLIGQMSDCLARMESSGGGRRDWDPARAPRIELHRAAAEAESPT